MLRQVKRDVRWRQHRGRGRGVQGGPDVGARQITLDLTCPVREFRLWTLSVLYQMRRVCGSGHFEGRLQSAVD